MKKNRIVRVNSLLQEVIAEVITKHVKNPHIHPFTTITRVETSRDIHYASVYISVIDPDKEKKEQTVRALQSAAGFIAVQASKKVVLRYFPALTFKLDRALDNQIHMTNLLYTIEEERANRPVVAEQA